LKIHDGFIIEQEIVNSKNRNQRIRLLLKNLNKERRKQAKQIDILCNDIISSQRDFIERLKAIDFRANFYELLLGITELNSLLSTAAAIIKEGTAGASITFFLRHGASFEKFNFDDSLAESHDKNCIESCFSSELMTNICMSNKICSIDDMFAMGLQGNLTCLNTISLVTIPLGSAGSVQGFILIYRSLDKKLTSGEIKKISAVTAGLSQAICACKALMHSSE
jgi:hypothetical protein